MNFLRKNILKIAVLALMIIPAFAVFSTPAFAATPEWQKYGQDFNDGCGKIINDKGEAKVAVRTKFKFGCVGKNYSGDELNPIMDMAFAVIKVLSVGVGLVVTISIIAAGIQYSMSGGNPEATTAAKSRIRTSLIALVFYVFIFSALQYLVPGGIFN